MFILFYYIYIYIYIYIIKIIITIIIIVYFNYYIFNKSSVLVSRHYGPLMIYKPASKSGLEGIHGSEFCIPFTEMIATKLTSLTLNIHCLTLVPRSGREGVSLTADLYSIYRAISLIARQETREIQHGVPWRQHGSTSGWAELENSNG